MKRLFDISISIIVLLLFSPFYIVIALCIFFNDRGPVLYPAKRVGQYGKEFRMYKFRTMVVNADKIGASSTTLSDSRITGIGRFLRKTKLDEIPQFINVFIGNMSIVGPRPDVKTFTDLFTEEEKKILSVKPGITDWASVWNSDEGKILEGAEDPDKAYMELIWPGKKKLQLKYVNEHSFLTDIKIIWLTLAAVLKK
ncbi:MAG TPA: sugar transferase [Bacteroidales bacterium]|nr:sugar transferase [Bacteroidales bacterium]HPS16377.1 sugar transferase [Bacteroidales bacterium]